MIRKFTLRVGFIVFILSLMADVCNAQFFSTPTISPSSKLKKMVVYDYQNVKIDSVHSRPSYNAENLEMINYYENGKIVKCDRFEKGKFRLRYIYTDSFQISIKDTLSNGPFDTIAQVVSYKDCTCIQYMSNKNSISCTSYSTNNLIDALFEINENGDTINFTKRLYDPKGNVIIEQNQHYSSQYVKNTTYIYAYDSIGNRTADYIINTHGEIEKITQYENWYFNVDLGILEYDEVNVDKFSNQFENKTLARAFLNKYGNFEKLYYKFPFNKDKWVIREYKNEYY